jgi:hypothetical protein
MVMKELGGHPVKHRGRSKPHRARRDMRYEHSLTSAHPHTVYSCSAAHDWSSNSRPKKRAKIPGQIIKSAPRATANTTDLTIHLAIQNRFLIMG